MVRVVGKWAARLSEKTSAPLNAGTDRTDKRGALSVLSVTPERGEVEFLSAWIPSNNEAKNTEAFNLASVAWTDDDLARFIARRARLLRWGWPEPEAERLADRLARRDREDDFRASCADCQHYRPGFCNNHRQAGLSAADIGRDLVEMLQHCPGFQPLR